MPGVSLGAPGDPRVYTRDGFAVTLWTYYEPVTPQTSPVVADHSPEFADADRLFLSGRPASL
jgi:hypothetical protein